MAVNEPDRPLAKLAYGALFCLVLPVLLVLWARGTADVVPLPGVHAPVAGGALLLAGLALMAAGTRALHVHGGGLPMNAFPPPRFVSRGVYALHPHPIYFGFGLAVVGVSLGVGSASGLWLVSPAVVLGMTALVHGYERPDLEKRFGEERPPAFLSLPRARDGAPSASERLAVLLLILVPWVVAYEAVVFLGVAPDARSSLLPFEAGWRVVEWTEAVYASTYLFVALAPLVARRRTDLAAFAHGGLLATVLVTLAFVTVPLVSPPRPFEPATALGRLLVLERAMDSPAAAFPSFHVVWALLAARLWARSFPRFAAAARAWGAAISLSCLTTGMHSVVDVAAGAAVVPLFANPARTWEAVRSACERLANSWREWRLGPVRVLNHGAFIGAGSFLGVSLAGVLVGREGTAAVLGIAMAGLVGAGLWAQLVEGSSRLARPFGYYGGLLGAVAGTVVAGLAGTDPWLLGAALAAQGPFIQAVGRLRCLANGCCHGRSAPAAVGIRYTAPRTRPCRLAGLSGIPLYPTQLFSILWNLATGALLLRLWWAGAATGLVLGLYLLLNGLGRFAEEAYRGEPQTPVLAGLALYQWTALASVACGALVTVLGSRTACPAPELSTAAFVVGGVFGLAAFLAMGVDFPDSDRRFARLA